MPAAVVTVIGTEAIVLLAGTVAVICPSEPTVKPVAAVAPKATPLTSAKFEPAIATDAPPLTEPFAGLSPAIVGGGRTVAETLRMKLAPYSPSNIVGTPIAADPDQVGEAVDAVGVEVAVVSG